MVIVAVSFLGQVAGDWWDTPAGQRAGLVLSAFIAIAAIAGGVKGLKYLWDQVDEGGKGLIARIKERRRVERVLSELTEPARYPNGSTSIPTALHSLYDRIAKTEEKLDGAIDTVDTIETRTKQISQQLEALLERPS